MWNECNQKWRTPLDVPFHLPCTTFFGHYAFYPWNLVNVPLAAAKSVRDYHTSNDCVNPKNRGDPSDRKLLIVFQRIPRVFRGTAIEPGISHYLTDRKCLFSELFECTDIPLCCWFHRRIIHWLDASRLFILPWLTFSVTSRIWKWCTHIGGKVHGSHANTQSQDDTKKARA